LRTAKTIRSDSKFQITAQYSNRNEKYLQLSTVSRLKHDLITQRKQRQDSFHLETGTESHHITARLNTAFSPNIRRIYTNRPVRSNVVKVLWREAKSPIKIGSWIQDITSSLLQWKHTDDDVKKAYLKQR